MPRKPWPITTSPGGLSNKGLCFSPMDVNCKYIYININIKKYIYIYIYICNGGKGMNMMDSIFWQPIFRQTHFTTALDFADLNDARKTIPREQNEVSFMSDAASKLSQLFLRA